MTVLLVWGRRDSFLALWPAWVAGQRGWHLQGLAPEMSRPLVDVIVKDIKQRAAICKQLTWPCRCHSMLWSDGYIFGVPPWSYEEKFSSEATAGALVEPHNGLIRNREHLGECGGSPTQSSRSATPSRSLSRTLTKKENELCLVERADSRRQPCLDPDL